MAVKISREGAVARILIDRPAKANALDSPLLDELAAALGTVESGVRAVVLAGSGKTFCGGADVEERRRVGQTLRGLAEAPYRRPGDECRPRAGIGVAHSRDA